MLRHLRTFTPFVTGLVVLAFGLFFADWLGLYDIFPHFDKVIHVAGGVVAAWFVLALLQGEVTRMAAWKQMLIIISVATLIGVVWEWAEFLCNNMESTYPVLYFYFHGGDLADTLGDLVSDVAGALLFSLWALRKERS